MVVGACLFAQDWFVCVGSYSSNDNADELVYSLQKKGISTFVYAYTKENGNKLFRVLIDEPFDSRDDARKSRDLIEQSKEIKDLNLSGLWICQAEKMPVVEAIPVQKIENKSVKIVLGWNDTSLDLDSYLISSNIQIDFENREQDGIILEFDEEADYAPEIITISDLDLNETYQYFVEDYDNCFVSETFAMSNSGATVKYYENGVCKQNVTIVPESEGTTWHVFDIINGEFVLVNEVNDDAIGE